MREGWEHLNETLTVPYDHRTQRIPFPRGSDCLDGKAQECVQGMQEAPEIHERYSTTPLGTRIRKVGVGFLLLVKLHVHLG